MKRAAFRLLLLFFAVWPAIAGDLVVISHPKSGVDQLSREEVVYIFMGRWRQLPSGIPALPFDLPVDSAERADFYRLLVNKTPAEINVYWSRLVFSGGARPPREVDSRDILLGLVAATPGALAYLPRSKVDGRVRVVFDFAASP